MEVQIEMELAQIPIGRGYEEKTVQKVITLMNTMEQVIYSDASAKNV
jgi:hypothetical protein